MRNTDNITRILRELREGREAGTERLIPLIYEELRRTARRELRRHRPGDTLDTSALVHEAYLKLAAPDDRAWNDRAHFFAVAATAMRQIIVDQARRKRSAKHGGGLRKVSMDERRLIPEREADELVALDDALEKLAKLNLRLSRVVECRFFAGLTVPETAAALGCSPRTVDRDWKKAKAWLYRELSGV